MENRAFTEVFGVKPGGGRTVIRGRWSIRLTFAAAAVALFPFTTNAQGVGKQLLHGHKPPAIARFNLQPMSRLPATNRLNLAIGLPLRNQAALNKLLSEIYDPASTNYHRYLTPGQFTEQFGPTEQDYQKVINFAKRNGLTVTATHDNRVVVDVSGPVLDIEHAFGLTLRTYRHPTENRMFHAPDVEPSVESGVPILDVSGLDDYALPHPQSLLVIPMANSTNIVPNAGSGPNGYYRGNDFRAAYLPGVALNGAGQTVGLLEYDGYYANDIATYTSASGLTNVPLQNVLLDGVSGIPGYSGLNNGVLEVSLDIEMAIAMAPALAKVVVFEGNTFNDMLTAMVASNSIKQFGCSWSYSGTPNATMDQLFQQMSSQGQSFFDASGDSDAYTGSTGVPNDDPNITIVGGTTLSTTGPGGSWISETVWNFSGGVGSSGGISTYYSMPAWQQGVNMMTNRGSTTMRNIPDVALTADQVWCVHDNGNSSGYVYGTSIAAPLWAGLTALVNQQAASSNKPPVGLINQAIYEIGRQSSYSSDFHDVTSGNNFSASSPTNFPAVPGYDLCTGWGTPNGTNLINALVNPDPLAVSPVSGFISSGSMGGPFTATSQSFSLTNSGTASLNWSFMGPAWLNVSPGSGTLAATNGVTVTVSLNSAASNLVGGDYLATLLFTNQTSGVGHGRLFELQVKDALIIAPANGFVAFGPIGGPFTVASQSFSLTNSGAVSLDWSVKNIPTWLNVSPNSGTLAAGSPATNVTVSLNSVASNLLAGIYNTNLAFMNLTTGSVQLRQFTLQVGQPLIQNGGFETGDFTGWTLNGDGYNYNYVDDSSTVTYITPHSGTYFASLGESGFLAFLSQNIPTVAGQSYLLSMWLENPPSSPNVNTPNAFVVQWNGSTLFGFTNKNRFAWSNLQFIVTAPTSSSILNIGAQDNYYYLGLDDVSLVPIPAAKFQPAAVTKTNNNLKFTWNAMTGLVYQVQYSTNLLKTNWIALQSITATNTPITFVDTNPVTGSPQKFYRLLLLP